MSVVHRWLHVLLLSSLILVVAAVSCGSPYAPPPAFNCVDMTASDWDFEWAVNMPAHPAAATSGWSFNLPAAPGLVSYLAVPFEASEDLTGKTLNMTFRVTSNLPVYDATVGNNEIGPASFHLFFERLNDDMTNEYYRWWCGTGGYVLGSADNQTLTVSCPLTYTSWSDVYGAQDQGQFTTALQNVGWVGITFGAQESGWGHGVGMANGTATFEMLSYSIQ